MFAELMKINNRVCWGDLRKRIRQGGLQGGEKETEMVETISTFAWNIFE